MKEQNKILTLRSKLLLCLVAGFVALFALVIRVDAAGPFSTTYEGVPIYFTKGNVSFSCGSNYLDYSRLSISHANSDDFYVGYFEWNNLYCMIGYCPLDTSSKCQFVTYSVDGGSSSSDVTCQGIYSYSHKALEYSSYSASFPDLDKLGFTVDDYCLLFKEFVDAGYAADFEDPVEVVEKENFSLTGFTCDNTISATWNGVSGCPVVDRTDVEVLVQPSYMYILDSGESFVPWDEPEDIIVDYNDMGFSKLYSDFMNNNPHAGSSYLTLSFTPQVVVEGKLYKGSTIRVKFDELGNSSGVDIPTAGLPLVYSDFYLKDFSYLEDSSGLDANIGGVGRSIKFMWNGPSFGDSINYITSEVKVEIYTMSIANYDDWGWITYEPSYHVGIDRDYVQFNLLSLDKELRENRRTILNKDKVSHAGVYFRFTPYYKTSDAYCYGRSVYVQLSKNGTIISCTQSIGDAFSEDNPGFENVVENLEDGSSMGDLLDNVFTPSEDDFNLDNLTLNFFSLLQGLISSLGQFPSLFKAVFSFLPDYYISMLVVGLSMIILLRILGR